MSNYRERVILFTGHHVVGDRLLKEYTVAAVGQAPSAAVVEAGRASVASSLAASAPPGAPAFSVIHAGEDACFYVAYWWAEGCILHCHAESAPLETPALTVPFRAQAVGCT